MKTRKNRARVYIGLLLCVALYSGLRIVSGRGQGDSQGQALTPWKVKKTGPRRHEINAKEDVSATSTDRVIEDQIPAHIPIRVELRKHDVEPLLRNLEVSVTNTSAKPIYYLSLHIILPNVMSFTGHPIGFPLQYGRIALVDFQELIGKEDLPIPPGGNLVFKVSEDNLAPFEGMVAKKKISQSPVRKVELVFDLINFGDKSGFAGRGGEALPNPQKTGIAAATASRRH